MTTTMVCQLLCDLCGDSVTGGYDDTGGAEVAKNQGWVRVDHMDLCDVCVPKIRAALGFEQSIRKEGDDK